MAGRYVSIWFSHLATDWFSIREKVADPDITTPYKQSAKLTDIPFVLRTPYKGRMVITAANVAAQQKGIDAGMVLADARAIVPDLKALDAIPGLEKKILRGLAEWFIRFSPIVVVDPPDGLILDAKGCTHLWGGDNTYIVEIVKKLKAFGYTVRAVIADTPGVAWAVARFGKETVVEPGLHIEALLPLPPEALRLDPDTVQRFRKLGLHQVRQFLNLPRSALRRRFGERFIQRIDMVLGRELETLIPVRELQPYQERLPCLEPIVTAKGIRIALEHLLQTLCGRLQQEQKGLRLAVFKGYRVDRKVENVEIGTNLPTHHVRHLLKLFENKLQAIEPALGIELFTLEAKKVEDLFPHQEKIWEGSGGIDDIRLSELMDRLAGRLGMESIQRYFPDDHYWPERSFRNAVSLHEKLATGWRVDKVRPLQLLPTPEWIEVTAPIPDYPPMLFRYKGKLHKVIRADGPERIEQEWWIHKGKHRDYYRVEDEAGLRFWIFRSGHYDDKIQKWFVHGFFA